MSTDVLDPPMTVLHVGAGRKHTLEAMGMTLSHPDGRAYTGPVSLVNLDMLAHTSPDIVCELGRDRIDAPDDTFDAVLAFHVLEHIGRQGEIGPWFYAWEELYRVLKPSGIVKFECPYFNSVWAWADPTHTRAISEYTFLYLNHDAYRSKGSAIPDYRPPFDFELIQCELRPDTINPDVVAKESASHIAGMLRARKPLKPYWED